MVNRDEELASFDELLMAEPANPADLVTHGSSLLSDEEERLLVCDLTRSALEEYLPEELGVFDNGRAGYLDRRGTIPAPRRSEDEATGFGAEIVIPLIPYIVAAATAAVHLLAGVLSDALKDEAKPLVARYVRSLLHRGHPDQTAAGGDKAQAQASMPPLPTDILARVHAVTIAVCTEHGLGADDAALVSDAVTGRLALPAS